MLRIDHSNLGYPRSGEPRGNAYEKNNAVFWMQLLSAYIKANMNSG